MTSQHIAALRSQVLKWRVVRRLRSSVHREITSNEPLPGPELRWGAGFCRLCALPAPPHSL